jgi:PAS domain S-box-containing protein
VSLLDALGDRAIPDEVRSAIEAGAVGAVVADSSRVMEANDAYLELTGFSRAELAAGALSWLRLTPPEWLAADARAIGAARATGGARAYDKAYVRRDGSRVEVVLALLLLEVEPLRVFGVVAAADDEAGRRAVEALAPGASPGA